MALKKLCRCGLIIDYTNKYCSKCKDNKERTESNKQYDVKRKDNKEWNFYKTREWLMLRERVLSKYNKIDVYSYYMKSIIAPANTIHHIVEIKNDWDKRLNVDNMFPCSIETHSLIHQLYKKDKLGTQILLRDLINKYLERN